VVLEEGVVAVVEVEWVELGAKGRVEVKVVKGMEGEAKVVEEKERQEKCSPFGHHQLQVECP
jgi:hypothetical protein